VVNATWGQAGYSFLPAYLDTLALSYDAGLRILDFMADPEAARATINAWVSAETADRIRDLLQPGTILPTTRLVLTNAIYFSAAWAEPFPKTATREGDFHLLDGSVVKAPLMSHRADFGYAAGDGYEAVELLYDGKELSMVVLLPAEGRFEEFEASLDAPKLTGILAALLPRDIQLTMPRFSSESELGLVETLRALGMSDAFTPGVADFSGIDGTRDLFISGVVHKAFVSVDEDGTEAAAATAVIIGIVSVPQPVRADRPFIFLVRDIPTGAILFLGRVLSP
jgi:serpin B